MSHHRDCQRQRPGTRWSPRDLPGRDCQRLDEDPLNGWCCQRLEPCPVCFYPTETTLPVCGHTLCKSCYNAQARLDPDVVRCPLCRDIVWVDAEELLYNANMLRELDPARIVEFIDMERLIDHVPDMPDDAIQILIDKNIITWETVVYLYGSYFRDNPRIDRHLRRLAVRHPSLLRVSRPHWLIRSDYVHIADDLIARLE